MENTMLAALKMVVTTLKDLESNQFLVMNCLHAMTLYTLTRSFLKLVVKNEYFGAIDAER